MNARAFDRAAWQAKAISEAGSPEVAAAMEWAFGEADRLNAGARQMQPRPVRHIIPAGMTEADRLCWTCHGFGYLTDTHAYGDPTTCTCHRCGGTGIKA